MFDKRIFLDTFDGDQREFELGVAADEEEEVITARDETTTSVVV